MNTDTLAMFVLLDERKRGLEAELKEIEPRLEKLRAEIQAEFEREGVGDISFNGRRIYVACDRWPKARNGDRAALVDALQRVGLKDFVNFNSQSLRGYVNELIRNRMAELTEDEKAVFNVNDAIPEHLKPYLEVNERFTIRSRKA